MKYTISGLPFPIYFDTAYPSLNVDAIISVTGIYRPMMFSNESDITDSSSSGYVLRTIPSGDMYFKFSNEWAKANTYYKILNLVYGENDGVGSGNIYWIRVRYLKKAS